LVPVNGGDALKLEGIGLTASLPEINGSLVMGLRTASYLTSKSVIIIGLAPSSKVTLNSLSRTVGLFLRDYWGDFRP